MICSSLQGKDVGNVTGFTAEDIDDYNFDQLDILGRSNARDPANNVIEFICGDNCATNVSLARKRDLPLIGCYWHRLNLEVYEFVKVISLISILITHFPKLMWHQVLSEL